MTNTKAKTKEQKPKTGEDEAHAASSAALAATAAADGQAITKTHAKASEGAVASEVQETTEKDVKIRDLIQERKTTAKHEKERICEISKEIKNIPGKTKGRRDRKEFRRSWKKSKEQKTYPVSNQ